MCFAKQGGCFQQRFFVFQHDNFRMIKHRMTELGRQVHCTKISAVFDFQGHRPHYLRSPPQNVSAYSLAAMYESVVKSHYTCE